MRVVHLHWFPLSRVVVVAHWLGLMCVVHEVHEFACSGIVVCLLLRLKFFVVSSLFED